MPLSPQLKTAFATLTWFPVLFVAFDHVVSPCQISGFSMSPALNPGVESTAKDVALVQKFNIKRPQALQRGDVVLFRSPANPEKLLTKRIVGVQGEVVLPRDPAYPRKSVIVPRNHLWVEGDNAFHSIDSNNFGPISQGLVVGKLRAIVWPLSRFGSDFSKGGRENALGDISSV